MKTGHGTITDVAKSDSLAYFNGPDVLAGHQRLGHNDPVPKVTDEDMRLSF
jgi:hypothetical protein